MHMRGVRPSLDVGHWGIDCPYKRAPRSKHTTYILIYYLGREGFELNSIKHIKNIFCLTKPDVKPSVNVNNDVKRKVNINISRKY